MKEKYLEMVVIYDHPKDCPEKFVGRIWRSGRNGAEPTEHMIMADTLDGIREKARSMLPNPCNIGRHEWDDPCIVEVWV